MNLNWHIDLFYEVTGGVSARYQSPNTLFTAITCHHQSAYADRYCVGVLRLLTPEFDLKPPRKRMRWAWAIVLIGLIVIGGVWASRVSKSITGNSNILGLWPGIANPRSQFPSKDRSVILVIGKDYNYTKQGIAFTKDSRADTIMLLGVDFKTPRLSAVGIPRDTRVEAPDGITGKVNVTFQRGGVKLLSETLEKSFGVHIDYHIVLKADAVKAMVDAVGGVEVEPIDDMFYEDSWAGLYIDLKRGRQRINGKQAVGFVRFRKTGDHKIVDGEKVRIHLPRSEEEGDLRRNDRQRQLVRAVATEALKPANLWNASSLVDTAFQQIETNLTRTQVLALATLFRNGGAANMEGTSIPGSDKTIGGLYYWVPDTKRAELTIKWLLNGDLAARKKLTRIVVYHTGADRRDAANLADRLDDSGYSVVKGGRTHKAKEGEVTYRKAADESLAREIAGSVGIQTVRKETAAAGQEWVPEIKVIMPDKATTTSPE